jgi:hypothetical protein
MADGGECNTLEIATEVNVINCRCTISFAGKREMHKGIYYLRIKQSAQPFITL